MNKFNRETMSVKEIIKDLKTLIDMGDAVFDNNDVCVAFNNNIFDDECLLAFINGRIAKSSLINREHISNWDLLLKTIRLY